MQHFQAKRPQMWDNDGAQSWLKVWVPNYSNSIKGDLLDDALKGDQVSPSFLSKNDIM